MQVVRARLPPHVERLRAESSAAVTDAIAADRMAAGAWLRLGDQSYAARCIERGDHVPHDESITGELVPPIPSLREVLRGLAAAGQGQGQGALECGQLAALLGEYAGAGEA